MFKISTLLQFVISFHFFEDSVSLFLRVETGHQNIAIDGRDSYYGHFTKIHFHNLTCIQAIDVHCLKELTGAEEIDLLYSECHRGNWKVAHYTNSKHHFRLKQPIHALRLLISSRRELSIIDAQVESCNSNTSKPLIDCHHLSRNHAHRHGKVGSILRAVDPFLSVDDSLTRRRFRRSADEAQFYKNEVIPSGEQYIKSNITVQRGSTLTILPGANLKFERSVGIIVNGKIHINGTKNQPVSMSPYKIGDRWKGLQFLDAEPGSILSNVKISDCDVAVDVEGGTAPYMEHLLLSGNEEGVKIEKLEASSITHLYKVNSVNNLKNGINYQGKGSISIDTCVAASNGKAGILAVSDGNVVMRRTTSYSNNDTGIYIGTSDAVLEDVVVNSNKKNGIFAQIAKNLELYNVNVSAHFFDFAMVVILNENCRVGISNSHFHDNKMGGIKFGGNFSSPQVVINNSNFTRNTGRTIFFENAGSSSFVFEKCGFMSNIFQDFDRKDAVIQIDDFKGIRGVIQSCQFSKNTMHDIIRIHDSSISGSPINIQSNKFTQNLANSIIFTNSASANIAGNQFGDQRASCEVTLTLPRIPQNQDLNSNVFLQRGKSICTGDYHAYSMDQPNEDETTQSSAQKNHLENPFKTHVDTVAASQTPYLIDDEVYINSGETVKIEAGSVFDFAPGIGITVHSNGKLIIEGLDEKPVVLRGQNGNTWRGLVAKPEGSLNMSNVVLEDASIGVWIDSEKVYIKKGQIIRPVVHGVEITHNSNDVVDLGGIIIEGANDSAIGVDERRDDLLISNAEIRDSSGSGIDFVTPTGNIEIRDVKIDNVGEYAIHISEFPSSPLHAVLMTNISVLNQKKGEAGVMISGGWIQNIGLHDMKFSENSVPSLIVALECNDENEKLVRIENSNFTNNQDIVQHVQLGACANFQMEKNIYNGNNENGIGSTFVLTTDKDAVRKNGIVEISKNNFTNNSGTYTTTLDSKGHSTFFTNNILTGNINSGAVLKLVGENSKIITNKFDNLGSRYQISYIENAPLDASFNDWSNLTEPHILESIDAREGSVNVRKPKTSEQIDPFTTVIPVTVPYEVNVKCAHLKYCSLRGTCRDGICVCPLGFTGFDCSIPTFCNCSGHGLCDIFNRCLCDEGYSGLDCSTPKCFENCSGNGNCVAPNRCECSQGWMGETCSTTSCVDSNCLHGHCSNGICKCEEGWKGSKCHVPICDNCTLNGVCTSPGYCKCFEDYGGTTCGQCIGTTCEACDFDCDHGFCDPVTRTCSCASGWSGGACDVCSSSKCTSNIKIFYIQPSTAELEDTNNVVNVYGSEFAKTEHNSYVCTFGQTTVTGKRVTSSLLRCPIPANITIGRHVFSVTQPGSLQTIGSVDMRPIHFTIFDGCDSSACQGSCVGPLCICPQGKTGVFCDVIEIVPTIDRRFLEHQRANRAFEGTPYVLMLPTMASSVLRVNSSIPHLNFIASKGIIAWPEPVGSEDPYTISVTAYSPAGESTISWNVTVDPEYNAEVQNVTVEDGQAKISGKITKTRENARMMENPVLIRIRREGDNVIDEIQADTDTNGNIKYNYIPMLPGNYVVSISHPGRQEGKLEKFNVPSINMRIAGETTHDQLKISVAGKQNCEAKLLQPKSPEGGSTTGGTELILNFGSNWTDEVFAWVKCDGGPIEIVRAPSDPKIIASTTPSALVVYGSDRLYQVLVNLESIDEIRSIPSVTVTNDGLELVSTDPKLEDFITSENKVLVLNFEVKNGKAGNGSVLLTEKERVLSTTPFMFFSEVPKYVTFKICVRDEWDGQERSLASSEVATIAISNIQNRVDIAKPNIRMNVQWAEFTLLPGMYNLEVRSESHEPFQDVVLLDPLNTTFCVFLTSSRSKSLPTVRCSHFTDPSGTCEVEISSITGTDELLPYLKFEPSVVTSNGQKVSVVPHGNQKGVIGLWNPEIDGFNVTHSRRSLPINQSFWTTVSWNNNPDKYFSSSTCDVQLITLPFVFLPDGSEIPVHSSTNLLVRKSNEQKTNRICDGKKPVKPATSTKIMCNCGDGARSKCRERYRSATACGSTWAKIADDTVSLEVLVSFLLMVFECKEVSVDFSEIKDSLQCVASIESDCPISTHRKKRSEFQFQQDSPVRIVNHLSSVHMDLGKVLPVLNALDVQTIRISTIFIEFVDRMQKVFPSKIFENLDRNSIDTFLQSISDQSEDGQLVSETEKTKMLGKGNELINLWNETVKSWKSGKSLDDISEDRKGISYQKARDLVNAADRLKSISRQNIALDPYTMLHGYMERILETGESEQRECATSTVYIDETEVEEDAQIRIRVFIQNRFNASLTNIGVTLNFFKSDPTTPNLNFNIGPSWSAGIGSLTGLGSLNKGGSFEIHWTRFINAPRRLTTVAKYQPIIIFAFSANGRQTQQKLFAQEIMVIPKKTVKAINIIKDELSPHDNSNFSIISSVINPGYSTLKNVEIYFNGLKTEGSESENPTLHSVFVNGKEAARSLSPKFSEIQSGSTQLVKILMKNQQGTVIPVNSVNITCAENGKLLPLESTDSYAIRAAGPSDYGMLLAAPHQSAPLFFFRPSAAQMVNVIRLEFLSMQKANTSTEEKLIYLAAFRNPESSSFGGALWARMPVPEVGENTELDSIMDRSQPRPRELQAVKWETEENGNPILNWIDSGGFVQQKVVTYELVFLNPKDRTEKEPMFEQSQYRIEMPPEPALLPDTEIGQILAEGDDLTYSLYSPDNNKIFSVDLDNGKVYYNSEDPLPSDEYCVVVEAKDANGRTTRVPLAINNGGQRGECVIFGTDGLIPMIHFPTWIPTPQVFSTQTPSITVPTIPVTADTTTRTTGWLTAPSPEPSTPNYATSITYPDSTLVTVTVEPSTTSLTTSTTSGETTTMSYSTESTSTVQGTESTTIETISTSTEATTSTSTDVFVTSPETTVTNTSTTEMDVYVTSEPVSFSTSESTTTSTFETTTEYIPSPSTQPSTESSDFTTFYWTPQVMTTMVITTTGGPPTWTSQSPTWETTSEIPTTWETTTEAPTVESTVTYTTSPDSTPFETFSTETTDTTGNTETTGTTEIPVTEATESTSTQEVTVILPTDPSTISYEMSTLLSTTPTTEMTYTMTSDSDLPTITTTETIYTVTPDPSPSVATDAPWNTPIVVPTQGGDAYSTFSSYSTYSTSPEPFTSPPYVITTLSYDTNAQHACQFQESHPIYKIVCDLSNLAKPVEKQA